MVIQNKALAVSVPEAAKMLGVSTRTLQNLIAAKQIRITKIGRRTIISVTVLEDFLRSGHGKNAKIGSRIANRQVVLDETNYVPSRSTDASTARES